MNKLPTRQETFIPILDVLSTEGPLHYKQLGARVREKYYNDLQPQLLTQKTGTGANMFLNKIEWAKSCPLYTSPSPPDQRGAPMPSAL